MVTEQRDSTATIWPVPARWPSGAASPLVSRLRQERQDGTAVRIQQQAQSCLESSGYAPLRVLRCRIDNGTLVIYGEVQSYYLKQVAQELVRRLKPIRPIVNEITVTYYDNH